MYNLDTILRQECVLDAFFLRDLATTPGSLRLTHPTSPNI